MSKTYKVYTQKCMAFLVNNGFKLIGIQKDKKGSKYNVFLFNDSNELREFVSKYKTMSEGENDE